MWPFSASGLAVGPGFLSADKRAKRWLQLARAKPDKQSFIVTPNQINKSGVSAVANIKICFYP